MWPAGEKIQSLLPVTVTGLNTKWEAQLAHACLSIRHGGVHNPKGAQTENEEYNILAVFSEDIFVEVSCCVHMFLVMVCFLSVVTLLTSSLVKKDLLLVDASVIFFLLKSLTRFLCFF